MKIFPIRFKRSALKVKIKQLDVVLSVGLNIRQLEHEREKETENPSSHSENIFSTFTFSVIFHFRESVVNKYLLFIFITTQSWYH